MIDSTNIAYKGDRFLRKPINGKLDWWPSDTEELFLENLKKFPNNKSLTQYKNKPLTYNLNSEWFRTPDEFSINEVGNVFLGCSHTFGIGHYLENTWAYKVNQYAKGKFWNLGLPGCGAHQAYIVFQHYHSKFKIKNVFVYIPHPNRFTRYIGNKWNNFLATKLDTYLNNKSMSPQSVESYLSPEYTYINFTGYLNAIENICSKNNYKMYLHTEFKSSSFRYNESLQARDLTHMPLNWHEDIANTFINSVKNNSSMKVEDIKLPT